MAYTTIDDPELYFQVVTWTGNGSASRAISLSNTDANTDPDLVWIKIRTQAYSHSLFDSTRGVTKWLSANENSVESDSPSQGFLTSFDTDGFTVEDGSSDPGLGNVNKDTDTYVAWCWKESATAGFDIVSFEGNGTARTISHSLSAVPAAIIIKNRERTTNWLAYHQKNTSAPETDYLEFNNPPATVDHPFWNDTAPTSSVFSVGDDVVVNADGEDIITYLWSEKQGFSKFGTYVGSGNASGPFIYTGFRPAWVMIKNYGRADTSWTIYDKNRPGYNPDNAYLLTDANDVEASDKDVDLLSNGFKPLLSNNAVNTDDDTYIYMAFAEAPFVNSKGVPCNAR